MELYSKHIQEAKKKKKINFIKIQISEYVYHIPHVLNVLIKSLQTAILRVCEYCIGGSKATFNS